jgi:DNA-binding NtrC family response regulator
MTAKILIVDDELPLLSAMSDYLTSRGYDCECASEVAEAMALLSHISFDVVITDVYLSHVPQADGFAVVTFIRERALASKVIVMTAHDTPQVVREAQRLAADLFLRKPIPLTRLAEALGVFTGAAN